MSGDYPKKTPRHARNVESDAQGEYSRTNGKYHSRGNGTLRQLKDAVAAAAKKPGAHSSSSGSSAGATVGRHAAPAVAMPERRISPRRIAAIAGIVLALLLAAIVAYGVWFTMSLDAALASGSEDDTAISEALVPAEAGEPFYVLVLGSDSREGNKTENNTAYDNGQERSDVMILVRVDAANQQITMVTIPRDTPYYLEDGTKVKINQAYNKGGAALTIKAISELTGVPISHYAALHFSSLENIVDSLGGVTVTVDQELAYMDALTGEYVTLEPGEQTLNGQQAQIFARARHEYSDDQDAHRQNNVRALAVAIVESIFDRPLYEIPNAVISVAGYVDTDMRTADIMPLLPGFASGIDNLTVYSCTGPYKGEIDADTGLWFCYENPDGWAALMAAVDAGEDPTDAAASL